MPAKSLESHSSSSVQRIDPPFPHRDLLRRKHFLNFLLNHLDVLEDCLSVLENYGVMLIENLLDLIMLFICKIQSCTHSIAHVDHWSLWIPDGLYDLISNHHRPDHTADHTATD